MSTRGFPDLWKKLYELLGGQPGDAPIAANSFPTTTTPFPGLPSTVGWNRHFGLKQTEPVIERDYGRLSRDQLTVWDDAHPAPEVRGP